MTVGSSHFLLPCLPCFLPCLPLRTWQARLVQPVVGEQLRPCGRSTFWLFRARLRRRHADIAPLSRTSQTPIALRPASVLVFWHPRHVHLLLFHHMGIQCDDASGRVGTSNPRPLFNGRVSNIEYAPACCSVGRLRPLTRARIAGLCKLCQRP